MKDNVKKTKCLPNPEARQAPQDQKEQRAESTKKHPIRKRPTKKQTTRKHPSRDNRLETPGPSRGEDG